MILNLDFNSDVPIYAQIKEQIIKSIATGDLKLNESLPSVRNMAEEIGVNLHTVNKAYNLLKNTDLPVTQISFDVGFSNVSYFIRSFKEKYKVTPKELRLRADDSFNV